MSTQPGIEYNKDGNPEVFQEGDVLSSTYKYPLSKEDAKKENDRLKKNLDEIADRIEYTTPCKYRFRLDKDLVEKEDGKYVVYIKRQDEEGSTKHLIENLSVEWAEYQGRITRAQFYEAVKGTKGIIKDSVKGDFKITADEFIDELAIPYKKGAPDKVFIRDEAADIKAAKGIVNTEETKKHIEEVKDTIRAELKNSEYYTPTKEEFYIGFEYKAKNYHIYDGNIADEYWETDVIESRFDLEEVVEDIDTYNPDLYRVKYLDKEDIESLGWKYDNNAEPYPEREPYECPIAFSLDTQLEDGICYIMYLYSDNIVWIEWIKDCSGKGYIFKGKIKNKSELKKVLQCLDITLQK